jgi:hypothetical protein
MTEYYLSSDTILPRVTFDTLLHKIIFYILTKRKNVLFEKLKFSQVGNKLVAFYDVYYLTTLINY